MTTAYKSTEKLRCIRNTTVARRLFGAVVAVAALGFLLWVISGAFRNMPSAGIALSIQIGRPLHEQLIQYYTLHGTFPPAELKGDVYSQLPDVLTTTIVFPVVSRAGEWGPGYEGPAIDPFRKDRIFENEDLHLVRFRNLRYSHPPFHWYSGFPPRYFRSTDGQIAVIIANGPDEDADIESKEIIESSNLSEKTLTHLASFTYDATNGTTSGGDIFRIVVAPEPANTNPTTATNPSRTTQ